MSHKLDEHNIIKYYGECVMGSRLSLILEVLDINLLDYILNTEHLMRLADIRSVIQQVRHQPGTRSYVNFKPCVTLTYLDFISVSFHFRMEVLYLFA